MWLIVKLTYENFIVLLQLDYRAVKMAQQASSWKQVLPKIGPTIIYIRRNFDNWVMRFYLSSFPLVGKASIPYICPESREKVTTNARNWLPCLFAWLVANEGPPNWYLPICGQVMNKKVPNWGKFAANLGRLPFLLSGNLFFRIHAKSNQKSVHTLLPHSSRTTNSIPQYPRCFWMCLLNLTKACPSNQHPCSKMGKISKSWKGNWVWF